MRLALVILVTLVGVLALEPDDWVAQNTPGFWISSNNHDFPVPTPDSPDPDYPDEDPEEPLGNFKTSKDSSSLSALACEPNPHPWTTSLVPHSSLQSSVRQRLSTLHRLLL